MPETFTIVGSSVASLVAALQAAQRGHRVDLYVDPRRIGGSFGGLVKGARRLDLGCRLLELDYEGGPGRPIATFDPVHDSHRPFIAEVARFIEDVLQGDLRPARTPEMLIGESRTRCVLMTVDLSDLPAALTAEDRRCVRGQVRDILAAGPATVDHPRQTLREASLAQHGQRLHDLLTQAVCAKHYAGWEGVLAVDRRKLWAALFQPRTILEAFSGSTIGFQPNRPFATTLTGGLHPFVDRLYQSVKGCERISVIPAGPVRRLSFDLAGLAEFGFDRLTVAVPAERCVIAETPDQVFQAVGQSYAPERMVSSMVWIDVAEGQLDRDASTLTVCDPDLPVLRMSNVGAHDGRHCFAVESGHRPPCFTTAVAALQRAGVIRAGAAVSLVHQVTGPAQTAPTLANARRFERAQASLAAFPGVLLGGLRRFLFDGLNDQITDAMYFGATRC